MESEKIIKCVQTYVTYVVVRAETDPDDLSDRGFHPDPCVLDGVESSYEEIDAIDKDYIDANYASFSREEVNGIEILRRKDRLISTGWWSDLLRKVRSLANRNLYEDGHDSTLDALLIESGVAAEIHKTYCNEEQ